MFSVPLSGPSYEAVLRASEVSLMKLPSILPSHHRGTQRCLQNHSGLNHVKIEHLANPVKFLPDGGCDIKESHGEVKKQLDSSSGDYTLATPNHSTALSWQHWPSPIRQSPPTALSWQQWKGSKFSAQVFQMTKRLNFPMDKTLKPVSRVWALRDDSSS